ncbi:MAG: glycine cleavage system aminomethyltransferase GcvT [Spirochaetales bacterium]|nr:glycine cleavage system aminomethyltransferase GcvT [Spirochaetales bacterium]
MGNDQNLKRTPLYQSYSKYAGAKFVDFGGWELPVQFEAGIIAEHMAVRKNAGMFDVSHMGEIIVEGPDAEKYVDYLVTNDVKSMEEYQVIYTLMCYPDGGVVDDLLVYKYSKKKYLLVVNASNVDKDYEWIVKNKNCAVSIENISNEIVQIAFQGPKAEQILQKYVNFDLSSIKFFHFKDPVQINGIDCIVSRTGYTGEDGFEIYVGAEQGLRVWDYIYEKTRGDNVLPCGLGCRDTLRFEAKLPLYGHEISKDITPIEAGLKFFVKLEKDNFIGKEVLVNQVQNGVKRSLKGLEMIDKGVPRSGYKVFKNGKEIGFITTGSYSPMLDKNVALALIESSLKLNDEVEVEIHGKLKKAILVKTPFYKNTKKEN